MKVRHPGLTARVFFFYPLLTASRPCVTCTVCVCVCVCVRARAHAHVCVSVFCKYFFVFGCVYILCVFVYCMCFVFARAQTRTCACICICACASCLCDCALTPPPLLYPRTALGLSSGFSLLFIYHLPPFFLVSTGEGGSIPCSNRASNHFFRQQDVCFRGGSGLSTVVLQFILPYVVFVFATVFVAFVTILS